MKKLLALLLLGICFQANALYFPTSFFSIVCNPDSQTEHVVFDATIVQVLEPTSYGVPVQFSISETWCGEIKTEFNNDSSAPEWAADLQNTDDAVWVLCHGGSVGPSLSFLTVGTRFVMSQSSYDTAYFYTWHVGARPPLIVDDNDMVTGLINAGDGAQTMSLETLRAAYDVCSGCESGLGIEDSEIAVSLFPNPASTHINLDLPTPDVNYQVEVYNTAGALVKTTSLKEDMQIDIASFSSGLYFVNVLDDAGNSKALSFVKD